GSTPYEQPRRQQRLRARDRNQGSVGRVTAVQNGGGSDCFRRAGYSYSLLGLGVLGPRVLVQRSTWAAASEDGGSAFTLRESAPWTARAPDTSLRSEEHTSELQSPDHL